jgi:hypothetical protein
MATMCTTVNIIAKWQIHPRKWIEFVHGGYFLNFLRRACWTVVTDFVEWNSSTQYAFLDWVNILQLYQQLHSKWPLLQLLYFSHMLQKNYYFFILPDHPVDIRLFKK